MGNLREPEGARERALCVAVRHGLRRVAMGHALGLALVAAGLACLASGAAAHAPGVNVSVSSSHGLYSVRGAFDAPVSDTLAWQVLTDYDHIGSFVTSILYSAQGLGPGGRLRVTQVAEGDFFAFRRRARVVLDIQTEPTHRIFFADVLGADFRCYVGDWFIGDVDSTTDATQPPAPIGVDRAHPLAPVAQLAAATPVRPPALTAAAPVRPAVVRDAERAAAALHVRYVLQAQPIAAIPSFVGRSVIRHAVEDLLTQVRAEMLRRAGTPAR